MRRVSAHFTALASHLTTNFRSALAGPNTVCVAAPGVVCDGVVVSPVTCVC